MSKPDDPKKESPKQAHIGPYPPGHPNHPGYPAPPCPPGHHPQQLRLAEAYVPWQIYTNTYSPTEALQKGTLFPELYRPYVPAKRP